MSRPTDKLIDSNPLFMRKDFWNLVWLGKIPGYSIVQKFGRNEVVTTTVAPVSIGGIYQTPTVAVNLEAISDDAADDDGGLGVRKIRITGLKDDFTAYSEEVVMNGLIATSPTSEKFIRVFRIECIESGTYASQIASSQAGTITIREEGAGDTWAMVDEIATNFGVGQSQIGAYSVPSGFTAILMSKFISVNIVQAANIYFFQRPNIDNISAPFDGMRLVEQETGIQEVYNVTPITPINMFPEKTDIGFMAKTTAGNASVACNFELLLVENSYI